MSRPLPRYMAWVDLETTGTDFESSEILEVGIVLTDSNGEVLVRPNGERAERSWLVKPSKASLLHYVSIAAEVVWKMHDANGLWDDLTSEPTFPAYEVDEQIIHWMNDFGVGKDHVALGGSGITHFDRPFIREYLPGFDKRLTYWAIDVGVLRRTISFSGRDDLVAPIDQDTKTHRALEDAQMHLDEFRHYLSLFQSATLEAPA